MSSSECEKNETASGRDTCIKGDALVGSTFECRRNSLHFILDYTDYPAIARINPLTFIVKYVILFKYH